MEETVSVSANAVGSECEMDAGTVDGEDSLAVQTVYTNLTPVTIQDESGLRQVYVPVEQAGTLTSLAESISETTGSQHLPGIPGQLITITLPQGTTTSTEELQITDGTALVSLEQNASDSLSSAVNVSNENDSQQGSKESVVNLELESRDSQHDRTASQGEFGSELLDNFLGVQETNDQQKGEVLDAEPKQKIYDQHSKKSDDFTRYIRTLLTQPQEAAVESTPQENASTKEADNSTLAETASSKLLFTQVFSGIEATLSSSLLEAIPGSKASFLHRVEEECQVELKKKDDDTYSYICSETQVLNLYDKLSVVLPSTTNPFQKREMRHKGVNCDLLRPMFSRSGREVKPKQYEIPVDDEPAQVDNEFQVKANNLHKRKRGRPRKHLKGDKETANNIINETKVVTEVPDKDKAEKTSHVDQTLNNKLPVVSVTEKVDAKDTEHKTKKAEVPSQIELDPVTAIKVETLVDSVTLNDISDDTFHVDDVENVNNGKEDSNRNDLVKAVSLNVNDAQHLANLTSLKSQRKSKNLLTKKKPRKDYESLLPFKYFCNQCSFRSKRQSHYNRHMQLHEQGLPLLRCNQCSFTTIRLSHLRRHTLFHTSELHHCTKCKYKTYDGHHLNRHMQVKHPASKSDAVEMYQCPMCEYGTTTEFQYRRHLRVHADVSSGIENPNRIVASYQCPICDYNTKKKDHFARHIKQVHTEHRPYLCDLCGKSFKRQDTLRAHKVIHMDRSCRLYAFKCTVCTKEFRTQAHLTEHLSTHSNAREYLCEICGSSFKTRNVQRKHVRTIHKNPRSHKCPDCEKSFNTKFALQRHARTHDTPGMRKMKHDVSMYGERETIAIIPGVHDLTTVDQVTGTAVQDIGAEEVTADVQPLLTVPITTDNGTLVEKQQHIAIPLTTEIQQQVQEVPTTIQLSDASQTVTLPEGTYEQDADGSYRQVIPHFIQTGDSTAALLYVPNLQSI